MTDTQSNSQALSIRPTIVKRTFEILPIANFITEKELEYLDDTFPTREECLSFLFDISEALVVFGRGLKIHVPRTKAALILLAAKRIRHILGDRLHSMEMYKVSNKNVYLIIGRFE